ncbi:MAG: glycoside hydrolase family 9 protein [Paenibacillus sp.]|uniref:glycoside hydrolase family 9 protein n=1 Tax=Paenibacillus sp. TaxID=58172 RepID=UPI0029158BEF|nr:glycoside hydrolase family 9 protein [Paenibacillus sp.]MDU4697844.1 glycoside hydrolase family 9 protein [Paenibacillus sp.]
MKQADHPITTPHRNITVNQLGYPAETAKAFVYAGTGGGYEIVDTTSEEIAYRGRTGPAQRDEATGTMVCRGDFGDLRTPGTYQIRLNGESSAVFTISSNPYADLQQGLLKGFYYFRCGMELEEAFAGPWKHHACHTSEGIVYDDPSLRLDSRGGWHDAGDYGKYTGPGAKAVADLLLAYEANPQAFDRPIPLPDSDGQMPDVLHECRYELDWLFKMQDPRSGGAFHKLTTKQFPALDMMPVDDRADLYFLPVSATATACLAGVMAMAARIYRPFDDTFATRCLQAAERAWTWLERTPPHPNGPGFKNPSDVSTGEYGDPSDLDERYWAAAELYRTTGEASYHVAFRVLAAQPFPKYELGWANMSGYGTIAYLLSAEAGVETDAAWVTALRNGLIEEADQLARRCAEDGYLTSLRPEDYIWGSNMILMNNAMLLLIAGHFDGGERYRELALEHIHYLLGRNVLDFSYVSGFGDRPVNRLHHRPSVADGVEAAVPGLVSGGPNRNLNDDYMLEHLQGQPPAQCFADHELSYAGNEVTIYWNSPAVFVVSHFVK